MFGVAASMLAARDARACPDGDAPWVKVTSSGESLVAADLVRLLRAELAPRHIALCDTPSADAPAPLAIVSVRASAESASVTVDVRDSVTAKSVSRDVGLEGVPEDGRALTVAVAADELLRASWAELALRSAPPPRRAVPIEVREVVRDAITVTDSRPPRFAFGAAAALDAFTAGTTLLGADVLADVWIIPRLRITGRFGLRSGLAAHTLDGDVSTNAIIAKLGGAVTVTQPASRLGLDLALRVGIIRASFVATPSSGATGNSLADVAVVADAGVVGWLRLASNLRIALDVAASLPLRPVTATDGNVEIAGISGGGVASSMGLWGTF